MNMVDPIRLLSSGYGRLAEDCAGVVSRGVLFRGQSAGGAEGGADNGAASCCIAEDSREGGLERLAALAASRAVQSISVRGIRGDSPGVRGEGEGGRELDVEGGLDPRTLPSREMRLSLLKSALILGDREGDGGAPLTTEPSLETGRDVA